jgi:pimeloyl-ACP methyl ester carboxylesterase
MKRHVPKSAKYHGDWVQRTAFPAIAIVLIGMAVLLGILVYKISYPGTIADGVNPSHYLLPYMEIGIPSGKENDIPGWWIPGLKNAPGIVLAPGYGMTRSDALSLAVALRKNGFNLLIFEQRGSGSSRKGASTFGFRESEDMANAIRFLKGRPESDPESIGIWGVDVSAYAALKSAAEFPEVKAIAADNPFETPEVYVGDRITEDFGVDNRALRFSCFQIFRLTHLFAKGSGEEPLPMNALSDRAILFIKGEDRKILADSTTAIYEGIQPQKEMISFKTSRFHAMNGANLQDYDRQVTNFFHLNLK